MRKGEGVQRAYENANAIVKHLKILDFLISTFFVSALTLQPLRNKIASCALQDKVYFFPFQCLRQLIENVDRIALIRQTGLV